MNKINENVIGKNLKKFRTEQHFTQQSFAHHLHVSRQAISAYERGIALPDILLLQQIADLLNISLDTIVGRIST